MAARKKRRSDTGFDMQRAVIAHAEASLKAHAWKEKSEALRNSGMSQAAARAEAKSKYWLRKMAALNPLTTNGKPADC
jgi:hypothetical protein